MKSGQVKATCLVVIYVRLDPVFLMLKRKFKKKFIEGSSIHMEQTNFWKL